LRCKMKKLVFIRIVTVLLLLISVGSMVALAQQEAEFWQDPFFN
jgi:hypothetical protein